MAIIDQMIRMARRSAGLTMTQAGRLLGVPYSQIWAWETGRRRPRDLDDIIRRLTQRPKAAPTPKRSRARNSGTRASP